VRIGAFEITEPVPDLVEPHAVVIIPVWMDAGQSASMTMSLLDEIFETHDLARLSKPGDFFDFTRYRPTLSRQGDRRVVTLPNVSITYGSQAGSPDFVLLRLPEPNSTSEAYVDSVVELLKTFKVKRYGLLGSVYDMMPYTRPLLVTGSGSSEGLNNNLLDAGVAPNDYEGPTTVLHLVGEQMEQMGIETFSAIVHLPGYQTPENDYRGENKLLEIIGSLYGLNVPNEVAEKAKEQTDQFNATAEQFLIQQPQLRVLLKQLEDNYDARVGDKKEYVHLSPEVEKFLRELNTKFDQG
jgi:hypothetical protein